MFLRKQHFVVLVVVAILIVSMVAPVTATGTLGIIGAENACGPMDVVFLVDNTGSMGHAIDIVKNEAASIVNQIVEFYGYGMNIESIEKIGTTIKVRLK